MAISFGILIYPVQLLDISGPMDILSNITKEFAQIFAPVLPPAARNGLSPEEIVQRAANIKFHHIGLSSDPVATSFGATLVPNCTIHDCPPLDYLLVGGPDPNYAINQVTEELREFLRRQSVEVKTLFTTCTGAMTVAASGVLDGVEATVNHACLPNAERVFPKVKWVGSKNWVEGDKYWTSSGAVAGMDMFAEWARKEYGEELLGISTMVLDYQPRDIDGNALAFINGDGKRVGGSTR